MTSHLGWEMRSQRSPEKWRTKGRKEPRSITEEMLQRSLSFLQEKLKVREALGSTPHHEAYQRLTSWI